MLAEAAPTHLCTHSDACFAKRPIKASEDAWKGLRANRLRTVMIGVGAAQGGGRRERPSRAEGVRARARRACGARAERARHASGTPALAQRRPLADLAFESAGGGEDPTKLRVVDLSTSDKGARRRNILGILHHLQGFGASFALPRFRLAQLVVAVVL